MKRVHLGITLLLTLSAPVIQQIESSAETRGAKEA